MMVMILEKVPPSLKGDLSRWLVEVTTGVYVGHASALVRDLLWDKCVRHVYRGRCYQLYRANTEQGYVIRMHGDSERAIVDFDGLQLVTVHDARWTAYQEEQRRPGSMTGEIET
jgi:CRISPR-associated protein Cas2